MLITPVVQLEAVRPGFFKHHFLDDVAIVSRANVDRVHLADRLQES